MKLELKDKQVLVLGLGDTGLSALRWLHRQGARLSVADTRETPPGVATLQAELPSVKLHTGAFTEAVFNDAEIIVISPGVPMAEPMVQDAVKRGVPVVGDVELFAQYKPAGAKVIAITGANGKSTVTTLVGEMCKAAGLKTVVAGNIGLPVLDTLNGDLTDVYVLELSSFQLETTSSLNADAATVLNISEDHMDRYDGLDDYAQAKARVFFGKGVQVLNRQDDWSMSMALQGRAVVTFGLDEAANDSDFGLVTQAEDTQLMRGQKSLLATSEMKIAGLHNAANALAAMALCEAIGVPQAAMIKALREYKGLPHRVEWVANISNVAFYDDSKGTNVGATYAALQGLVGPNDNKKIVLIAGGDGKGQDFSPLTDIVAKNARAVVLIGRDAPQIGTALSGAKVNLIKAESLEMAVKTAFGLAKAGDAVLLSPACASFDMFRNYVHRAEVFVESVKALAAEEAAA
ncbi:MAG: UDP-N-acetylmuramoyl-L-alanine:D-glutamate ligase [Pseudomonadota bacterium]